MYYIHTLYKISMSFFQYHHDLGTPNLAWNFINMVDVNSRIPKIRVISYTFSRAGAYRDKMSTAICPLDRNGMLPNGKRPKEDSGAMYMESKTIYLSEKSFITLARGAHECPGDDFRELWAFAEAHVAATPNPLNKNTFLRRKQCTFGAEYKFGNQQPQSFCSSGENAMTWPKLITSVLESTQSRVPPGVQHSYFAVHANWYPGGAGVAKHADDEPSMITGMPIFSYTFLEDDTKPRVFNVYSKQAGGDHVFSAPLHSGDLVIMGGDMQDEFVHEIPTHDIRRFEGARRINLTVRAFHDKYQK